MNQKLVKFAIEHGIYTIGKSRLLADIHSIIYIHIN